jgi:hypothetical protein
MNKLFGAMLFSLMLASPILAADTFVSGYTKSNGTQVQPYYRSAPDTSFSNNFSTRGNVNPYTGMQGTRVQPPSGSYGGYSRSPSSSYGSGWRR